jgi:hypothetical protein
VIDALSAKGASFGACPWDGTRGWTVGVAVAALPAIGEPHGAVTGPAYTGLRFALVPVFCDNCGYTVLFSLDHLGLDDLGTQQSVSPATASSG